MQSHEDAVTNDIEARKKITFEQAEGVAPLPSQLQLREVSQQLRARLWERIHGHLKEAWEYSEHGAAYLEKPWSIILTDEHVYRQHRMVDDFKNVAKTLIAETRDIFENGDYIAIFGWLEFVLKHPACPSNLADHIELVLHRCRAAYLIRRSSAPSDQRPSTRPSPRRLPTSRLPNSTVRGLTSAMRHLT
jgi:hypothetical protein